MPTQLKISTYESPVTGYAKTLPLPPGYPYFCNSLSRMRISQSLQQTVRRKPGCPVVFSTGRELFGATPGNRRERWHVPATVRSRIRAALIFLVAASLAAAGYNDYAAAKEKFDRIESGKLRPGSRVVLSFGELNAGYRAKRRRECAIRACR